MLYPADKIGSNGMARSTRLVLITSHATCHAARRVARYRRSTRRCAGGRLRMPTVCIAVCAAQVILGDRPVGITVKRLWAALSLWDKVRLLWMFLCEVTSPSLVRQRRRIASRDGLRC